MAAGRLKQIHAEAMQSGYSANSFLLLSVCQVWMKLSSVCSSATIKEKKKRLDSSICDLWKIGQLYWVKLDGPKPDAWWKCTYWPNLILHWYISFTKPHKLSEIRTFLLWKLQSGIFQIFNNDYKICGVGQRQHMTSEEQQRHPSRECSE